MRWNEHYGRWFDQIPTRRAGGALRAVITDLLDRSPHHTWRVAEIVAELDRLGIDLGKNPSQRVSNLLRTEVTKGRITRVGWGRYGPTPGIPATTRRRIRIRAEETLQQPERATTSFYWTSS